jgi:hypothetical protein
VSFASAAPWGHSNRVVVKRGSVVEAAPEIEPRGRNSLTTGTDPAIWLGLKRGVNLHFEGGIML